MSISTPGNIDSSLNAGFISSIKATSIGSTLNGNIVLDVGTITGGVSLNNVNCGNEQYNTSNACISIGNIESYSNTAKKFPSLNVGTITSHGGAGVLIDGNVTSTGNAIQVGQ